MAINNRNIVEKQPVVIDPNFFLPPGVVDARYVNDSDTAGLYTDPSGPSDSLIDSEVVGEIPDSVIANPTTIQAPNTMTVIDQVVRIAADGRFVVDVVIEVEDIPGVANFEVRMSKV